MFASTTTFVTTPDGRQLFFPLGLAWRGYIILGSVSQYKRLQSEVGIITSVGMIPVMLVGLLSRSLLVFFVAVWLVFYFCWLRYRLRRMIPPAQRLSLRDSVLLQEQVGNGDWYVVFAVITFFISGILSLLLFAGMDSSLVLLGLIFSGCGACISILMLILRLWK